MSKKPYVALAVIVAGTIGWFFGVVMSTRINTAAAMTYADGLDLQFTAAYEQRFQQEKLHFQQHLAALESALADHRRVCAAHVTAVERKRITAAREQWRAMLASALEAAESQK